MTIHLHTALLGLSILQAPAGDSLELRDALAYAARHRTVLIAGHARVLEGRASLGQASTLPNPVAGYGYTDAPPRHTVTFQQPFDWLLRRGPGVAAARGQVLRALADSTRDRAALDADVRRAFFQTLAALEARRVAGEQMALTDSLLLFASVRLERGDISAADHARLKVESIQSRQALSRARAAAAIASAGLTRALGWPDSTPLPPLAGPLSQGLDDPPPPSPGPERLPLVRGAEAESLSAAARLRGARAARVPLPDLQVGKQWNDPTDPGKSFWLLGLSLPLPLFDRGGHATALAEAGLSRASSELGEARQDARLQITAAGIQLEESAGRARLARDSLLPEAQRLRTRAALAYTAGETGILPLLEALRTEREIASSALEDLVAYQDALSTWIQLTGSAP